MRKKSLANSNRHLRSAATYRSALIANVASSAAIETGQRVEDVSRRLIRDPARGRLALPTRRK
jgi:hypothetical protein